MSKRVAFFVLTVLLFPYFTDAVEKKHDSLKAVGNKSESIKIHKAASGICPQNRKTEKAPSQYFKKMNPLALTKENIEKGKQLFTKDAKPTACKLCHGPHGNGNGNLARRMEPPPRNFTCREVMENLPDGQLFWIIQNGSKNTAMPAHKFTLSKEEIWQLILYIRKFLET